MSVLLPQAQMLGIVGLLVINTGITPGSTGSDPSGSTGTAHPTQSQTASGVFEGVSCRSAKACTAVGESITNTGNQVTLAEHWNGKAWSVQPTPNPQGARDSGLAAVSCAAANACTAIGASSNSAGFSAPFAEQWNGTSWTVEPVPNLGTAGSSSQLIGVSCASATACMAVGYYLNSTGNTVTLADYWNGAQWAADTTPNPPGAAESILSAVSCQRKKACTAVGHYNASNGQPLLAEHWNGKNWAIQTIPSPQGTAQSFSTAISCASGRICMMTGAYTIGQTYLTVAERRDDGNWAIQSTANPSDSQNLFFGLSCHGAQACTGVGYFINNQGAQVALAERWNGTTWTTQVTSNPGGERNVLTAISCPSASECTAVGLLQLAQGTELTVAERWDGSHWVVQPTPSLAAAKAGG
jgi:hypothetical protein